MTLLDDAKAHQVQRGTPCSVLLLLHSLSEDDAAELQVALTADVEATALSRALTARGHRMSADSIRRHRNRVCLCPF